MSKPGFSIYEESCFEEANFVSKYTFFWVWKFFIKNYKSRLQVEHLQKCPREDMSHTLGAQLESSWKKEIFKGKTGGKASLFKAIARVHGLRYFFLGLLVAFVQCVVVIFQSVITGWLVRDLEDLPPNAPTDQLMYIYIYGAGVCGLQALNVVLFHPYYFGCSRMGMDIRIACCNLIYKKALKLSQSALQETTVGQIVNMLSNDVNRFDMCLIHPTFLVIGPLMALISTYVLFSVVGLGVWCLPGISILLLYIPLQAVMGRMFSKIRAKTALLTDERVRLMNEFVGAMKVIKMYTWEQPFANLVDMARRREVEMIRKSSFLRGLNLGLFFVSAKVILFVILILYVTMGGRLTAEIAFVAVSLINSLRLIVCLFLPYGIAYGAEGLISMKRIEKFLLLDELPEESLSALADIQATPEISLVQVNASYKSFDASMIKEKQHMLQGINFTATSGQLLAIIGSVGSGKSSVLMAILGELPVTSGTLSVKGSLTYASQEAWTFAGTVRENITFGKDYEKVKYREVIRVCALERDLALLPMGDKTLIGDKSLSGGQRARVNLARALYSDADTYLLDDPLSAVDTAVAKHIFEEAIRGYLKEKIVILVTHQLQFIKSAHKILLLKNGKPLVFGEYGDILSQGIDFIKFRLTNEEEENPVITPGPELTHNVVTKSESIVSKGSIRSRVGSNRLSRRGSRASRTSDMMSSTPFEAVAVEQEDSECELEVVPEAERAQSANSGGNAYWIYISAGGGCLFLTFIITQIVAAQVVFTGSDWWLSQWTEYQEHKDQSNGTFDGNNSMSESDDTPSPKINPVLGETDSANVIIYSIQIAILTVLAIIRTMYFFVLCMRSSVKLHDRLFRCLVRAPMSFFDNNPVGVLLNRCSRDMGIIDDLLPPTLFDAVSILLLDLGIAVLVCVVNYWTLIPTFVLLFIFYFLRKLYLETARGLKRLEGITRSPVFSHLSTSINGLTTIRAFRAQRRFESLFDVHQNCHSSAWFMFVSSSRWFGEVLDSLCVVYIMAVTVSMLVNIDASNGSTVGLAITSAIMLSTGFQWGVRQATEVETQMTSVERVDEYSHLPSEGALEVTDDQKPPEEWPQTGEIIFENVSLKYNEEEGPVLKNLSFTIKSEEKIGIVGRTGAGKSSLISTLFRLTEPTGAISIDGQDVLALGLHDLRRKVSIIPQEPILFSGTVRRNLDPFAGKSDGKLWRALDEVQLRETVQDMAGGLDGMLSGDGSNFSVGQRQLLCLARAILTENKILILDEATANVDPRTDALIQATIRKAFADCTILTIAHRLDTIIDSDRVLVLDAGRVAEFDEPSVLLKNEGSIFNSMVKSAGKDVAKKLKLLAQVAYDSRRSKM